MITINGSFIYVDLRNLKGSGSIKAIVSNEQGGVYDSHNVPYQDKGRYFRLTISNLEIPTGHSILELEHGNEVIFSDIMYKERSEPDETTHDINTTNEVIHEI